MTNGALVVVWLLAASPRPVDPGGLQAVGVTTGALSGSVTDPTGARLPGVSVIVSGDGIMGTRSGVTSAEGRFEVSGIPPGSYTLTFQLPGFAAATREQVRVNLAATTSTDVVLEVAEQREAVVVSGPRTTIDRSSTAITATLDAMQLADLPASRSPSAILAATPSVQLTRFDVGGNTALNPGIFSAYGTTGLNRPTLEGIALTGFNPLGFTLDYGSFEHVSVGLGAYGPDWPWPGVNIQVITKSGANRYAGTLYVDYESRRWQSFNIDHDQVQRGAKSAAGLPAREANRLWNTADANLDSGGPLRKDRLWWYGSVRSQTAAAEQLAFPVGKPVRTDVANLGGKLTARGPRSSRFVLFGQTSWNRQPNRLDGYLRPTASINPFEDSTTNQTASGGVWKVEWSGAVTPRLFVEALAGQFVAGRHERPNGSSPRYEDTNTLTVLGGNRDWAQRQSRDQLVASATFTLDGPAGSHSVKIGTNVQGLTAVEQWYRGYTGNILHVTKDSVPSEVYLFETPSKSEGGQQWYAAYVNDSWRATNRLTISVGLRFDRYRSYLPAQTHPAGRADTRVWEGESFPAVDDLVDWNVVAPRAGAAVLLTGDGRTVFKVSYGRYWMAPGTDVIFNANPNSRDWWARYAWSDRNRDGRWDPDESTGPPIERRGGAMVESIDAGLAPPFVREATTRIERDISSTVTVATGVVWRGERQPILRQDLSQPWSAFSRAVTAIDPGVDGRLGTADDGTVVVHDLAEKSPLAAYAIANVAGVGNDNVTWAVDANRRLHRRWSLLAGFSHTWARENANAYFGQSIRNNVYPLSPNDVIATGGDGRHDYRVWSARAYGTWVGPWGLRVTPFFRHQSGQPFGRTFQVGNLNAGSLRVLAEPIGTRRMDHVTLLDARVEEAIALGPGRRVSVFLDVFNVLNANPEQNVNWSSAGFLSPIAIVPPRVARIGLRLAW